jgi:hypothetical protein
MNADTCFMCDIELNPDDETIAKVKIVWESGSPAKVAEVCEDCLVELMMMGSLAKAAHLGAKWVN